MTTTPTYRTLPTTRTNSHLAYVSFGTRDGKGRELGTHIHTYTAEFTEVAPGGHVYYNKPAGRYFVAEVHATRGQVAYGALQRERYFATPEGRDLYLEKYLKGARKRALKQFPPASTCQLCGEPKPADQACICCDNHCQ